MNNIRIEQITDFDESLIDPINSLLKQLTSHNMSFTEQALREIIESNASRLFILFFNEKVAAMLTLGFYSAPTSRKAWIEDVVVDIEFRGNGFGRKLVQHAIDYTRNLSPITLMLTSNPQRKEANALYQAEGFEQRCTNVYKMEL